jgi:uncharacterized repeat protein (TIGR01451 family)
VCTPPVVDGALQDLFDFALCIEGESGCGHVVYDDTEDICILDSLFDACVALEPCSGGGIGYFASGVDIVRAVAAHDRATDATYFGVRTAGQIGDADGDGDAFTGGPCDGTSIVDGEGIGPFEFYIWSFDFDCDGIFGEAANSEPLVTITNNVLSVANVTAGATAFQYVGQSGGTDLEARMDSVAFPRIWRYRVFTNFAFDGMGPDNAVSPLCPEPDLGLSVALACPTVLYVGNQGPMTATVTNTSTVDLANLALDIPLSAGLSFVAFTDTTGWGEVTPGNPVHATAPSIAVGEVLALTFIVAMGSECEAASESAVATATGSFSEPGCVELSGTQGEVTRRVSCTSDPTGVASTPRGDFLEPRPNPFTTSTRMSYVVSGASGERVEIGVYDSAGRRIRTLVSGAMPRGRHDVSWDGTDDSGAAAPAGVYFCRTVVGGRESVVRITRLK